MSQRFQPLYEPSGGSYGVQAIEVVTAQFHVRDVVLENLEGYHQELVARRNDRLAQPRLDLTR